MINARIVTVEVNARNIANAKVRPPRILQVIDLSYLSEILNRRIGRGTKNVRIDSIYGMSSIRDGIHEYSRQDIRAVLKPKESLAR